uniref:Uncharacterized protein n=1 Tax=Arundo donax TaxID=35708 RepID=A0A0A9HS42_ARUDO
MAGAAGIRRLWDEETTRNPWGSLRKAPSFAGIAGCRHLGMDLAPVDRWGGW